MSDKIKSSILALIVLILISLSLAGGVFYLLQKERAKTAALQEELEDVRTRQKVTEAKLEESKKLAAGLEAKLKDANAQIERINSDLAQEKAARQETLSEVEQLKADLEQQNNLKSDLEKKLSQAKQETEGAQAQLKQLSSEKTELENKIKDLEAQAQAQVQAKSEVELGKVVVSPETQGAGDAGKQTGPAAESGKVLVVNKEYNFAVINLGSKDGVAIGDTFSVYHDNNYIGDVKVEKTHDTMSAAGFTADIKDKVYEGDSVTRKAK